MNIFHLVFEKLAKIVKEKKDRPWTESNDTGLTNLYVFQGFQQDIKFELKWLKWTVEGDENIAWFTFLRVKLHKEMRDKKKSTSARFNALSSSDALELLSWIPSLDSGVQGYSDTSCWPWKTTISVVEASSKEAFVPRDYTLHNDQIKANPKWWKVKKLWQFQDIILKNPIPEYFDRGNTKTFEIPWESVWQRFLIHL